MSRRTNLTATAIRLIAVGLASTLIAPGARAELIESMWAAGMNGSWNVNEFWAPWGIPHNAGPVEYHAIIHSGYEVTMDLSVDITSLTVTPGSELNIVNSRMLRIYDGAIVNEGTIRIAATAAYTRMGLGGVGTIEVTSADGTGEIVMWPGTAPGYSGMFGTGFSDLVNGAGHTIRGSGRLGEGSLNLINEGLITADNPVARLELRPVSSSLGGLTNNSIIRAENGATLELQRNHHTTLAIFDNTNGTIEALDGSAVEIDGYTRLIGGELRTEGDGVIRGIFNRCEFIDITLNGELRFNNDIDAVFAGDIVNNGLIAFDSTPPANGDLIVTSLGSVNLLGTGTIELNDSGVFTQTSGTGATRLTNVSNTIQGAGNLGFNALNITNQGVVRANRDANLEINPPSSGDFTNEGSLEVLGAGGVNIAPGPFTTSGTVFIAEGSVLQRFSGDFPQTAGTTTVNGTLRIVSGGSVVLSGGALRGHGTIEGNVNSTGASVEPGQSPGELSITGTFTQGAGAALDIEIGGLDAGTQYDRLSVSGNVSLAGALNVTLVNGFEPSPGDMFMIVESTGGVVSGEFDSTDLPDGAAVTYTASSVVVEWTAAPCADLANGDGVINFDDLSALLGCWGPVAPGCEFANLDTTGSSATAIDFNDLAALLGQWGPCP